MNVIVMLIIAGGCVAAGFLMAFVWAVTSGQFDDTFTPAVRVLLDAPTPGSPDPRRGAAAPGCLPGDEGPACGQPAVPLSAVRVPRPAIRSGRMTNND